MAQEVAAQRLLPPVQMAISAARAGATVAPATLLSAIELAVFSAMVFYVASAMRQAGPAAPPARPTTDQLRQQAAAVAPTLTKHVWDDVSTHVASHPENSRKDDAAFTKEYVRSTATQAASQSIMSVADELGFGIKIWISRGDSKVRDSHRKLHGRPVDRDKPFKRWPNGQVLDYPGDRHAPIGEWIHCRCSMWLAPSREMATEALAPADLDKAFNLAASLEQRWFEDG